MTDFLLDTNHAALAMADRALLVKWSLRVPNSATHFGISITVLGELFYAVYASQNQSRNLARLQQLVGSLLIWDFDNSAAEEFGKIQSEQKKKGRPIPPMDAQIAAVARLRGLTLLSADRHFEF